jgi:(S)-sulfolactate dehydrogenase
VGPDNIDTAGCKARHIAIYPAVCANALSVAEYVVTTAAVLLRGAYALRPQMESGAWPQAQAGHGREIAGKTIGLIGFGGIARVTSGLAHAMGMAVTAYDPFVPDDHPAWGSTIPRALGGLIKTADVISLHVPLTPKTANMIDAATIARMKPGAIVINTAQGGVVDEVAVAAALCSGHLGGAALDTFMQEPLGAEHPFANAPNLILTPHVAGVTAEATARTSEMTARAVARHLRLAA